MTGTVTKGRVYRQDLDNYDGRSLSTTRTDSTGGSRTGLKIGDSVDVLTVYGAGVNYTGGSVQNAIRAVGSGTAMLDLCPGAWVFSDDLTIPSNITLRVAAGATLEPASGKTLTINGPLFRYATTYTGGAGTVTVNGHDNLDTTFKQSIWIPAGSWTARTTNGAASGLTELATNKVMLRSLDFDSTTAEYVQAMVGMPKSWNEGAVTYQVVWTAASGSGTVAWYLQAVATSDDDPMDVAFGTAIEVDDTLTSANDNHTTAESSAVTVAGTPQAKDLVCFQLYRDPTDPADNFSTDAKLIGCWIYYNIDTLDDA